MIRVMFLQHENLKIFIALGWSLFIFSAGVAGFFILRGIFENPAESGEKPPKS